MADANNILRPIPQRGWQITPASSTPSRPASPTESDSLESEKSRQIPPGRTRSILNLTSSTLFGIYSPNGPDSAPSELSQVNTPWGTGALTPQTPASPSSTSWLEDRKSPIVGAFERSEQRRIPQRHSPQRPLFILLRILLLFASGMAYGGLVRYLHDNKTLTPMKIEGIQRGAWAYLVYWGLASVVMGSILPGLDVFFEGKQSVAKNFDRQRPGNTTQQEKRAGFVSESSDVDEGVDWFPAVRGTGVFIGIAFAIRKLPWESTLQAIVTLVLVNPVLWYIVDRSKAGFVVSTLIATVGSVFFIMMNPQIVPLFPDVSVTASNVWQPGNGVASEFVGVSTWVASVIFCSCVCFRSIGKSLAL